MEIHLVCRTLDWHILLCMLKFLSANQSYNSNPYHTDLQLADHVKLGFQFLVAWKILISAFLTTPMPSFTSLVQQYSHLIPHNLRVFFADLNNPVTSSTGIMQVNQVDLNLFRANFNAFSAGRLPLLIKFMIIITSTSLRVFSRTSIMFLINWVSWKPSSVHILTLENNLVD